MEGGELKRLLGEHEGLKAGRARIEPTWRELARLVLPSHDGFGRQSPPDGPDPLLYDDAGEQANRLHAAVLNYLLTPDGQQWHGLEAADADRAEDPEAVRWCETATKELFKLRARHGFAPQIHECYLSIGAFGPGALLIEDRAGEGIRYEAVAMSELWFDEGPDGSKDRVHRAYQLKARIAALVFPELPEKLQTVASREPDRMLQFLHVVEPNVDRKPRRLDAGGMRFASWHVALDESTIVRRAGYRTMPYCIGRYLVAPGEVYGRSAAWSCLPTLLMRNSMARNRLIAANRQAQPPLLAGDDDLAEPPLLAPDAINYGWLDSEGRPRVLPMDFRSDGRTIDAILASEQEKIDRAFLVSLFLMMQQAPAGMTATEVLQRASEQGIVLAPFMGRLQSELLQTAIVRELDIASRMGVLPPVPPALVESGGLKVQYTSPLARLMAADETRGILETAQYAGMLAELDPSAPDILNVPESLRSIARGNRTPAKLLRTDDELAALRRARQEKEQAAMAIEAAPAAAQTVAALGKVNGGKVAA